MPDTDKITGGTAKVIGGRSSADLADSTPVVQATFLGVFDEDYTIPANTLKAGSILKIRAVIPIAVNIHSEAADDGYLSYEERFSKKKEQ